MPPPDGSARKILILAVFAASIAAVFLFIDLSPQVDRELFFSSDDPQLVEDRRIKEMFPGPPQIIVNAQGDDGYSEEYVQRVRDLSASLRELDGLRSVLDILHGPENLDEAFGNPLWQRLLVSEEDRSTNLVLLLDTDEYDQVVPAVEGVLDAHRGPDFRLAVSGEPYVVERMRELVMRDFRIFGLGALLVFSLAVVLLYRSAWIVVGALVAGGTATALTLLTRPLLGLQVDLLTPNITTIVFVLTLLHIVFLANNRELATEEGEEDAVRAAIRWTLPASFWAMVTTGIGFLSLLLAPATPAQNFGISCALGAGLAFLSAYLIFPTFLRSAEPLRRDWSAAHRVLDGIPVRRSWAMVAVVLAVALLSVPALFRLNTDPVLFEYFAEGSDIREGLERIDRAGGTTPMELVIRDVEGGELSTDEQFDRMWELQRALEEDPDVGSILSLPVLMAEAEEQTFWSFILSWDFMLEQLEDPEHDRIAASFVTNDRRFGRFLLRMKESARGDQTHDEVVERLKATVREHGFEPEMTGGLYPLQGAMTEMVSSSLVTGLLGVGALFVVVAFVVARSAAVGTAMIVGFSLIPLLLLAAFGYLSIPMDVIALPAANIALAIGVDNLIHLVHHRRREAERTARSEGREPERADGPEAWTDARRRLLQPILSSSLILVLGFGLLLASGFPPTRRLGGAVVLGSVVATVVVLFVFPSLAVSAASWRKALGLGRAPEGERP